MKIKRHALEYLPLKVDCGALVGLALTTTVKLHHGKED